MLRHLLTLSFCVFRNLCFWVLGLSVSLPGPYLSWYLIPIFFLFWQIVYVYLCNNMGEGTCANMPWCFACGDQRSAGAYWFSPSTMWVPKIRFRLYPWSHVTSPESSFFGLLIKIRYHLLCSTLYHLNLLPAFVNSRSTVPASFLGVILWLFWKKLFFFLSFLLMLNLPFRK